MQNVKLGALVRVKCFRASAGTAWCRRVNKEHVETRVLGVVVFDEDTEGKKVLYEINDYNKTVSPRGREIDTQLLVPHFPKLADICEVVDDTGGFGKRVTCGAWSDHDGKGMLVGADGKGCDQ